MEQPAHVFVPKHVIATETEVKELLARIEKPIEALPFIIESDPALVPLNAKVGDVVRIERNSPVTKKIEQFYRLVVEEE